METPPASKSRRLQCKRSNNTSDAPSTSRSASKTLQLDRETDDSPIYFPNTQESNEDIDVLWDWNSPQANKRKSKMKKRRLLPVHSPKIPFKRHPSNNQIPNFEKLREELTALQEQLAMPDDESCLCVSPLQEKEFKDNVVVVEKEDRIFADFDDMFNDSINEELLMFSQKIESACDAAKTPPSLAGLSGNYINTKTVDSDQNFSDDSFDTALSALEVPEVGLVAEKKQQKTCLERSKSEVQLHTNNNFVRTLSGKVEFHRTQSFEQHAVSQQPCVLPKATFQEIERKRLEALAKLEAKRKNDVSTVSPSKCSLEEIEKKRLEALAKREAKRMQDIIEKNRQEALKRLQMNRMKNATQVKSSLTKRL